jgi:hypothetical protein
MFSNIYPLIFLPKVPIAKKIGQQSDCCPRFQLYGWNYGNTPSVKCSATFTDALNFFAKSEKK